MYEKQITKIYKITKLKISVFENLNKSFILNRAVLKNMKEGR